MVEEKGKEREWKETKEEDGMKEREKVGGKGEGRKEGKIRVDRSEMDGKGKEGEDDLETKDKRVEKRRDEGGEVREIRKGGEGADCGGKDEGKNNGVKRKAEECGRGQMKA